MEESVIKMPEQIENRMVVDEEWDEIEYRVPNRRRQQLNFEMEERGIEDEQRSEC